jgi:hypothetical protein
MLLVPLGIGWAVGGWGGARAVLFLLASLSLFLARYPLTLLLRSRFGRLRDLPEKTGLWFGVYFALFLIFTIPLLYPYRLWWLIALGALALTLLSLSLYTLRARLERSEGGELLGVATLTLTAPGAYYVVTAGLDRVAFFLWALAFLYFGSSVFFVKMKVRQRPGRGRWRVGRDTALYHLFLLMATLGLMLGGFIPTLAPLAFLPLIIKVIVSLVRKPGELNIRRLGLTELGHSLLFGAVLVLAYRLG